MKRIRKRSAVAAACGVAAALCLAGCRTPGLARSDRRTWNPGAAGRETGRFVDPHGGFSYLVPEGWEVFQRAPDAPWSARGPESGGFRPTVVFAAGTYPGTNADSMDAVYRGLREKGVPYKRLAGPDTFRTRGGDRFTRVVLRTAYREGVRRQVFCALQRRQSPVYVLATLTAAVADGARWDGVFEQIVKSIEFER